MNMRNQQIIFAEVKGIKVLIVEIDC